MPQLAAAPSRTSQRGTYVFRSRPDLKPPLITLATRAGNTAPGLVITESHSGPANQGPMIIDSGGELVWFRDLSAGPDVGLRAFNVQVQALAGAPVLTWFQGAVVDGHGQGHYELWGPGYTKVAEVHAQNGYRGDLHEFVLTAKGTALFTCYGQGTANLSRFGGKAKGSYFYGVAQEVDVTTGKLLFEWRSDEHVGFAESFQKLKNPKAAWDYFHINSIDIDPVDGNLIISGRNAWAFYKVDRKSGRVIWQLGGKASGFKLGPGAHFAFQHDVRRYSDGSVTLFDNEGGPPAEASQSRGVVLAVDEKSRTATLLRQHHHVPPVLSESLGSVQELGDGHTFMGWGESSYFTEYDRTGKVVLDGRLTPGSESYRAFKQTWSGRPVAEVPAIAVVAGAKTATVYASYNGCTDLAGWVVLGGSGPSRLSPLGRAVKLGFETAITVPVPPAYLAVEAVSGTGAVLARSPAAQPR